MPTNVPLLGNSLFIVVCNIGLKETLLSKVAFWLASLRQYGNTHDVISFNKARVEALYCVQFTVQIVAPVVATLILDEACLR